MAKKLFGVVLELYIGNHDCQCFKLFLFRNRGELQGYSAYIAFQKLIESLEVLKIQIYKYIVIENRTVVHGL